jgi:predicted metal-dependent HD superfamily phosphohydrolase
MPAMDSTRVRWGALRAAAGSRAGARGEAGERLFAELDARYREPHRHYHGWGHILSCLDLLEPARGLCERPLAVELALWYHDAVYDPRAADNETRSAALARAAALALGLETGTADEAAGLVLLTTHEAPPPGSRDLPPDAAVVLDVDLAILGSSPGEFLSYEKAIRAEYAFVPDREYREGRSQVLRSFLDRQRIYLTDMFRESREGQARRNIEASLARLADQPT